MLTIERGINLHQSQRLLHLHECQTQCCRALYLQYNNKRCGQVRNMNHCRDALSLVNSPFNLQNLPLYVMLMVRANKFEKLDSVSFFLKVERTQRCTVGYFRCCLPFLVKKVQCTGNIVRYNKFFS